MKKITSRFASVALLAIACAVEVAFADTPEVLCWYHFDEAASGTRTSADSQIINSVLAGTSAPTGTCWSIDNQRTAAQDGNVMPVYGDGFPYGAEVYDPLTGHHFVNGRAMRFTPDGNVGAMVEVLNDTNWHPAPADTYTVEFFFKWEGAGRARYVTIMGCCDKESNVIWEARLHDNNGNTPGCITLTMHGADGNDSSRHATIADDSMMDDGRWHHVAICCTSAGSATVYLDYVAAGTLNKTFMAVDGGRLFIGSDPTMTSYRFNGLIDEVRITKGVLAPDQFLSFQNVAPGLTPDTSLLINFEPFAENWIGAMDALNQGVNLAPSTGPRYATTTLFGGSTFGGDSLPGTIVRSALTSSNEVANLAAFSVTTNSDNETSSGSVLVDDRSDRLTDSSFTVEMDVKCGGFFSASDCWYIFCGPDIKLRLMKSSKKLNMYGTGFSNATDLGGYDLCDGKWHHVAMVYDQPTNAIVVYVDYFKAYTVSTSIPAPSANSTDYTMIGAGNWGAGRSGTYNMSSGAYDNIRITRRALTPIEFQTSEHYAGSVMVWLGYDGDLSSSVYPKRIRSVSSGAFVDGGSVNYTTSRRGRKILDAAGGILKANAKALSVDGGKVKWSECSAVPNHDFTVEMFYRMSNPVGYAGFLEYSWTGGVNNPVWAIILAWDASAPRVWLKNPSNQGVGFPSGRPYFDGKWHHLAASLATVGENTEVKLYFDYELVDTQTIEGVLTSCANGSLLVGESWDSSVATRGIFDEVRIHAGIVGPESFMRASLPGFVFSTR